MEERLDGVILKGIGGFYYVEHQDKIYECKARGKIKQEGITPLVGDRVSIKLNNQGYGSIEKVLDRKNFLVRPMVANIDQAIIVQAMTDPQPDLILLDRLILFAEAEQMEIIICFNKSDLASFETEKELVEIYSKSGYKTFSTSIQDKSTIEKINQLLQGKINVFAGPSGVGKSSLLNALDNNLNLQTGEISKRLGRGKHTTRHAELLKLTSGGWVVDTPGFSSLDMLPMDKAADLGSYFREFGDYDYQCKFSGCRHDKEPQCRVKKAVEEGHISKSRYNSYIIFLQELNNRRKY
jgi:ribosome biogenesis GTPase / thiamine phosphate phosphatase